MPATTEKRVDRSQRQALLTATPPVLYGLGIAVGALTMGGPWHSIPLWRLLLGLALMALPGVGIVIGGLVGALRRLPLWGYTWAGSAVIILLLGAQTAVEELAEQGRYLISPIEGPLVGIALFLTNLGLLIVAAARGQARAGLVSIAQAAIMGLSLCQAATYAPFNRLDVAVLAAPAGLLMGLLILLCLRASRPGRIGVLAVLWLIDAGLVWLLHGVWREWLLRQDKISPAVPLLLLLTALLLAGPILDLLLSLANRYRRNHTSHRAGLRVEQEKSPGSDLEA